jgi:glutamate/tyrosine decarboxylase-like PLP-dependent enzyme
MISMGESGYLEAAQRILKTTDWLKREMREISDIQVIGDPLFMVAFQSDTLDVYKIMEYLTERNWGLNGLQLPPSIHICVTLRHTEEGIKERFLEDLKAAVDYVKGHPEASQGMGPIYGMAASIETRGLVKSVFNWVMDLLYKV